MPGSDSFGSGVKLNVDVEPIFAGGSEYEVVRDLWKDLKLKQRGELKCFDNRLIRRRLYTPISFRSRACKRH
jgi:hypothetical protein